MDGIERIKILAKEVKDKPLLKIIDYLLTRNDMNDKYLNKEKSLSQMIQYIKAEAKKRAINGVAVIEDEEVYNLAIHYFDEANSNLKINNNVELKETQLSEKSVPKRNKETNKKKQYIPEGQLSLELF